VFSAIAPDYRHQRRKSRAPYRLTFSAAAIVWLPVLMLLRHYLKLRRRSGDSSRSEVAPPSNHLLATVPASTARCPLCATLNFLVGHGLFPLRTTSSYSFLLLQLTITRDLLNFAFINRFRDTADTSYLTLPQWSRSLPRH